MKIVSHLYIYPIKGLGGIELEASNVTLRGLEYDRRYMLVDEGNRFLTQRTFPQMALLRTAISDGRLKINHVGQENDILDLELQPINGVSVSVRIWDDDCIGLQTNPDADLWFSEKLNRKVKLVYMPNSTLRQVDLQYGKPGDITSFSDGYPILMIGESSLEDLNSRMSSPVTMQRFRPNIVFRGGKPFEEDGMSEFSIGSIRLYGVKPCGRCVVTTIDPDRAIAGTEPLRTLSTYRTKNNKVLFGQNVICGNEGIITVGDEII